jgi:hypothetical protein
VCLNSGERDTQVRVSAVAKGMWPRGARAHVQLRGAGETRTLMSNHS